MERKGRRGKGWDKSVAWSSQNLGITGYLAWQLAAVLELLKIAICLGYVVSPCR